MAETFYRPDVLPDVQLSSKAKVWFEFSFSSSKAKKPSMSYLPIAGKGNKWLHVFPKEILLVEYHLNKYSVTE